MTDRREPAAYSPDMIATLLGALLLAAPAAPSCAPATGFTGTVCAPETPGRHPVVVVLGGSGGGDRLAVWASRFAERGYLAASVAYFGLPGLPPTLDEVPVETVGRALDVLARRDDADAEHIGLIGDSKGGELALFAASVYPAVHAVVGVVPSPFAWSGAGGASSWTLAGKPVRYVTVDRRRRGFPGSGSRGAYEASLRADRAGVAAAMFQLENIRGPVLLLAGDDDAVWDSPDQCRIGLEYLRAHGHAYADEAISYPNAGHAFVFAGPARPQTALGGTARGNVAAGEQAWPKIDAFFAAALQR